MKCRLRLCDVLYLKSLIAHEVDGLLDLVDHVGATPAGVAVLGGLVLVDVGLKPIKQH